MELGIHFANCTYPGGAAALGATLAGTARAAEEAGCTTFSLMDHYFQMEEFADRHEPMLEGYTSLGFLAGQTERMTLGLLVTGVTYRHPGLLAKIVTTLDVVSSGRAQLGIGAAWYEREHLGLGRAVPAGGRAVREARGDPPDLPSDVERRRRAVRRTVLPTRRDHLLAAPGEPAASQDPGGWQRRAEDAAPGRRGTPMPAISSPSMPPRSPTSSRSCAGTVTRSIAIRHRSRRRSWR